MKVIKLIAKVIMWALTAIIVVYAVKMQFFPEDTSTGYIVTTEEAAREASDMMLSDVYDEYSKNPYGFAMNHTGETLCLDMYDNYSVVSEMLWVDITGNFDIVVCELDSETLASLDLTAPYYIIGTVESNPGSQMTLTNCTFIPA